MMKEFKEFAMKGNVVDLAVGVVIGGAFGKIVSSLVKDVLMPAIGVAIGGVDFKNLALTLKAAEGEAPAVMMKYGLFIQNIFDFIIVAFCIFLMVKGINASKKKEAATPAAPAAPPKNEVLLEEIRDLLKK
jgi:large conductance mechanosensitive channel